MKKPFHKTLTATACFMLVAGASFCASAQTTPAAPSVTVYGRIDLSVESNSNGSTNRTAIENFSSRLGFKGEKAFDADFKGFFQVETGIAPDDSTQSKSLASRNSFVGLGSASMGSVLIGTNDMPLKAMEGTAAALWGEGDLQELIIHGKASRTGIGSAVFNNVHTRQPNVIQYTSPKFADVVVKLAYSPDELSAVAAAGVPAFSKPMMGASLYWDNGMFNAGYAYQNQDNNIAPTATTSGFAMTASKMTLGAKMDTWFAGVALSTLDNNNGKKTNNWLVSAGYTFGKTTLKASYGASSESSSGAADDLTASSLEADYALDKDLTLYTYYTQISNSKNAKGSFAAADNFPAVVKAGDSPNALGFGIRYNF